jgi:hypothetical protein
MIMSPADELVRREQIRQIIECQVRRYVAEPLPTKEVEAQAIVTLVLNRMNDVTAEEIMLACDEIAASMQAAIAALAEIKKETESNDALLRNSLRRMS